MYKLASYIYSTFLIQSTSVIRTLGEKESLDNAKIEQTDVFTKNKFKIKRSDTPKFR